MQYSLKTHSQWVMELTFLMAFLLTPATWKMKNRKFYYQCTCVMTMDTITWKWISQEISAVKVISFLKYAARWKRVWVPALPAVSLYVDEKSVALDNHFVMSLLSFYSFTFIFGQFFFYFMSNSHRFFCACTQTNILFRIRIHENNFQNYISQSQ